MPLQRKQNQLMQYLQLFLFILIVLTVQYQLFMVAFAMVIGFIIYMAIVSNQKRVFVWVNIAYLIGYLFFLYGDRIIDDLSYPVNTLMILSRCLLLIPIFFMVYVIRKFSENINDYWNRPNWQAQIGFPFVWGGFHFVSVKVFLLVAIFVNLVSFIPFISFAKLSLAPPFLFFVFLFSIVNGFLEELLWRGILLTRMVDLAGEKPALFFSSIAFGLSHLAFGYSWAVCLGFAVGGFFYAGITIRSGSILPAIIWHIVFNIFMILSGLIPYVG
ncbi:CPBP family intramembrane metalloprotease [Bacillus sp. FJAT-29790]|uniref:CPBP family intramembrane glutamic endopeptidase n=1 Tax=Bacillus sp. FJAT-29790 TaxID=1895002 RepID=UPI001C225298|nr:CPBP family intramembrane glutamic endopeptidase [Bacillus sp. FJAT-29790]MBU8878589.1 CPBP family intramembrane metalloprotease [Bacillus sp. FJAT-29790]